MNTDLFQSLPRRVVWFSCGAASAVAAKITVERNVNVHLVYCDTSNDEYPDNGRFLADVERWVGSPVLKIKSARYNSVEEVFASRKYMSGMNGAPCTVELKKKPRFAFQRPDDIHIFGMTSDEKKRAREFAEDNHELLLEWPLIDLGITKEDCLRMLLDAGITLPEMYLLGHKNNNCPGCVKATSPHYWNMIRRQFPAIFQSRCVQSRAIGCRLVRVKGVRIFLDELQEDCSEMVSEDLSCGPQCSPRL